MVGPQPRTAGPEPGEWRQHLLDPRHRWAFTSVLVGSLVAAAVVVLPQTGSATGLLDLRIYVGAAGALRTGGSVYEFTEATFGLGSTYPPVWSLLVLPFTLVDIHVVELVWTTANGVLWFATLWLAASPLARTDAPRATSGSLPPAPAHPWLIVVVWALSIVGAPVWNTFNQGQINVVIWLLIVLDVRRVLAHDRRAGILIGVAAALKLHPALAAVLVALAGDWRSARRAAVAFVVTTAAAVVVLWDDSWRYWTERIFDTSRIGDLADAQNNSIQGVLARAGGEGVWGAIALVVVDVAVVVLGAHGFRLAARRRCLVAALLAAGLTIALVLPISWTHHLVFLSLPLLLVVASRLSLGAKLAAIAAVSVLLIDPVGFGRDALTSDLRAGLMLALLAAVPLLVRVEQRSRTAPEQRRSAVRTSG